MKILTCERLKKLREMNDLTKTEIAKELKISDTAIGKWENGTREPRAEYLWKLADYFDVTVDYLIGRTDL